MGNTNDEQRKARELQNARNEKSGYERLKEERKIYAVRMMRRSDG